MNIKETLILNILKDPLVYLVQQLLKFNKIALDKDELAFQIKSHPSFPSLHAITGVLDHFNIENLALDVPINEETLAQLPTSFLAQVRSNNGKEFAIIKNRGLHYDIILNSKEKSTVSLSQFITMFTGILVAVEKNDDLETLKPSYNTIFQNTSIFLIIALTLISLLIAKPNVSSFLFLLFSILGSFISAAIFKQELGENSVLGNAFCSSETEAKSCDDVLSSKGAKLLANFKLSDLSVIYFSGLTIASYILILIKVNIASLLIISALTLPITFYSIYYQYHIIKKWCLLCLSIVGVLWIQTLIAAFNNDLLFNVSIHSIIITALTFLVAFMLWHTITPLLKLKIESHKTKVSYFKFKKNFNLFNTLLEKPKSINTRISNSSEIFFGNTKSPLNITVITNPFCGHCRSVHTLVENILNKYNDLVNICIRFNINTDNPEGNSVKIASRLLELYHTKSKQSCLEAMHAIYKGDTPANWLNKWGECTNMSNYLDILNSEKKWCNEHAINFTPEILVNGKSFPKEYDREDLIFFIEELHENCCEKLTVNTSIL